MHKEQRYIVQVKEIYNLVCSIFKLPVAINMQQPIAIISKLIGVPTPCISVIGSRKNT